MIEISTEEKVTLAQKYLEEASNMCYKFLNGKNFFDKDVSIEEILEKTYRGQQLLSDAILWKNDPKLLNE